MNCSHLFLPDVIALLQSKGYDIPVVQSQLGEEAAILGAGSYFL